MAKNLKKLAIIDGNALIHRAFHALPPLTTKDGQMVNAVYGFASILLKLYADLKPDYLAVTFDKAKKTFRHDMYVEYKATRAATADELVDQFPLVKNLVETFNIPIYELDGYEADDLIGTICKSVDGAVQKIIVTGDMDALQLVDLQTHVLTPKKGINETTVYDISAVVERYGLKPGQIIDYKALRGDTSDNIPGVPGIGEKTATELLQKFGDLKKVLAGAKNGDANIKPRYRDLLIEHEKQAWLSQKLATIDTASPIKFDLESARVVGFDKNKIFQLFSQLGFKSLLSRIPDIAGAKSTSTQAGLFDTPKIADDDFVIRDGYTLVNDDKAFDKFLTQLAKQKIIGLDTETTGLNTFTAELLGVGLGWQNGQAFYLPVVNHPDWLKKLAPILTDDKVKKVGHNLKYDYKVLAQAGLIMNGLYFDTMIAAYLLDSGSRSHSLDNLAFEEFGHQMVSIESLIGPRGKNQKTLADVSLLRLADYCCEDVDYSWRLYELLKPTLKDKDISGLFDKIEMPLVKILSDMELTGVKIDVDFLQKLDKQIEKQRQKADLEIFKLAGAEFNIDSPLQLKEILFDRLGLSTEGVKKLKTGFSTAAAELDKLRGRHKIIDFISEHRELAKLQSTYTQALPKLLEDKTSRVHTTFNQTIAATGRLSSSDPNLQNIPIRTELGSEVRKAFSAAPGYEIVAADYSQIELRIVASLANDDNMIEIFKKGLDIHKATAAAIHNVSLDEVTPEMRYKAKEVNFGVLYGMGAFGLSWRTGISQTEAQYFIEQYFENFSGVAEYLQNTLEQARDNGYVETLFGRRRYLPDIHSSLPQARKAAERMAVNAPIQGTAADLIKLAMIAIDKEVIKKFNGDVKMVLQVHDELVFEVKKDLTNQVGPLIKKTMEDVYKLRVPIIVEIGHGHNWGEAK